MKLSRRSEAQASEEFLKLLAYVESRPRGSLLEYTEVERETGIKMDLKGKSKLRRAVIRSELEYTAIPTVGYQLARADIAMSILTHRLTKIDNQVKRADRATTIINKDFYGELTPDEQRGVIFLGSVFGAIRNAAENGRKLYGQSKPQLSEGKQEVIIPT